MDPKTKKIVENLEREREALFRKFLEFSEMSEKYNEKAYDITCQIECINLALRQAEELGIIEPREAEADDGRAVSHVPRPGEEEGEGGADGGEEKEAAFEDWWDEGEEDEEEEEDAGERKAGRRGARRDHRRASTEKAEEPGGEADPEGGGDER